jgi:hypothetical protein
MNSDPIANGPTEGEAFCFLFGAVGGNAQPAPRKLLPWLTNPSPPTKTHSTSPCPTISGHRLRNN